MGIFSFFSKEKKENLNKGLFVTKQSFFSKLANAILGKAVVDDEVLATSMTRNESIELGDNELGIALTLKKV